MKRYAFLFLLLAACNGGNDDPQPGGDPFSLSNSELCETVFDASADFDNESFFGVWQLQKTVQCFGDTVEVAYDIETDEFVHHHEFTRSATSWNIYTFRQGSTSALDTLDGVFIDTLALPRFNYDVVIPRPGNGFPETGEIFKLSGENALLLWQPCAQADFCGDYQVYLFEKLR
ncbi:MAG: hypothetical protein AAF620_18775 [Bacteroidota bacterium]